MVAPWITAMTWLIDPALAVRAGRHRRGVVRAVHALRAQVLRCAHHHRGPTARSGSTTSASAPYHLGYPLLPGPSGYQIYPELRYGVLTNRIGGCCSDCGCTHLIRLRGAPVLAVAVGLRSAATWCWTLATYAIYDYSYIASPNSCWQHLRRRGGHLHLRRTAPGAGPDRGQGAGRPVRPGADRRATSARCPQRVTQVSRQGMSWTLLDPQDFLDKGRTGIYQVDLFLSTVNPRRRRLRSRVFSPDVPRGKTRRAATAAEPGVSQSLVRRRRAVGVNPTMAPVSMLMSDADARERGADVHAGMQFSAPATCTERGRSSRCTRDGRCAGWYRDRSEQTAPRWSPCSRPEEEVPPDTLLWRTNNYTLDLTADQVASAATARQRAGGFHQADDGSTTGQTSYPVERRTQ